VNMKLWHRKPPPPKQEDVAVGAIRALPITINPSEQEKIDHAMYRLDAMARHVEQRANVSQQRLSEFRREARVHIANLLFVEKLTEDQAKDWARRLDL